MNLNKNLRYLMIKRFSLPSTIIFKSIIPVANITPTIVLDDFDKRKIINDDLNMSNFKTYNPKDPVDDFDAVTKFYVDTKTDNINRDSLFTVLSHHYYLIISSCIFSGIVATNFVVTFVTTLNLYQKINLKH